MKFKRYLPTSALLATLIVISGCTASMPKNTQPDIPAALPGTTLVLFRLSVDNAYNSSVISAYEVRIADGPTGKVETYELEPFGDFGQRGHDYLVSLNLTPGYHQITSASGHVARWLSAGQCTFEFNEGFFVGKDSPQYLGHLIATAVEKTNDKQQGLGTPSLILIGDKWISGAFNMTIKKEWRDNLVEDQRILKARYPMFNVALKEPTRGAVASNGHDSPSPLAPAATPSAQLSAVKNSPDKCTTEQILKMKSLKLSDDRILSACQ